MSVLIFIIILTFLMFLPCWILVRTAALKEDEYNILVQDMLSKKHKEG